MLSEGEVDLVFLQIRDEMVKRLKDLKLDTLAQHCGATRCRHELAPFAAALCRMYPELVPVFVVLGVDTKLERGKTSS